MRREPRRCLVRVPLPQNCCSATWSPLTLSALLYLGAATALSAYRSLSRNTSREAQLSVQDLPGLAGIVFFGGIAGPILMLLGLQRMPALTGSLLLNQRTFHLAARRNEASSFYRDVPLSLGRIRGFS